MKQRIASFFVLCLVLVAVGFLALEPKAPPPAAAPVDDGLRFVAGADALARIRSGPYVVFRNTLQREGYGRVALAPLDATDERYVTPLSCDRVYFAGDHGICLTAKRGVVTTYGAYLFDAAFTPGPEIPLTGPPSRARVSPDGRLAAFTVFESGHSYASASFSTRTTIVDARTSKPVGELEDFTVLRDGRPFREADFNFWGVTFAADADRFYATLATGGELFLVEGSVSKQELRVLREGIECPSLSPDGTRLVYKARWQEGGRFHWGLRILDLASLTDFPLDGEARSVDDQAAWLDADHVMYGLPEVRVPPTGGTDVWVMEARQGAPPRRLLEQGASPAVVR